MGELLFGTTLLASFLGGMVALLAPCYISVMLPAYFATGFRSLSMSIPNESSEAAMTAAMRRTAGLGRASTKSLSAVAVRKTRTP
jgi:cytochrome c biogenesis protein CcdA